MSCRMVIRCDECEQEATMAYPATYSASSAMGGGRTIALGSIGGSEVSLKPQPPDGWFERYAGLQGTKDFCSAPCVLAWDQRRPNDVALA
jgi:hypothetical protein